jgi:hypothetical protein
MGNGCECVPESCKLCKEKSDMLVMMRTWKPRNAALKRAAEIAADLYEGQLAKADCASPYFMISNDVTGLAESLPQSALTSQCGWLHHTYTMDDIKDTYPAWNTVRYHSKDKPERWQRPNTWNSHVEPIAMAVRHAQEKGIVGQDGFVWLIEDDVGVCVEACIT